MGVHIHPLSPCQTAILDRAPQAGCMPVIHEYRNDIVYSSTPRIQFVRPLGYTMRVGNLVLFVVDALKPDACALLDAHKDIECGAYWFDSMDDLTTSLDAARENASDARLWASRLEPTLKSARMGVETNAAGKMPSAAGARAALRKALGRTSDYGINSSGSQGAYGSRAYGEAYYDFGTGYVYRKSEETDAEYKARRDATYAEAKAKAETAAAQVRTYLAENKPDWIAEVTASDAGRVTLHYAGFVSTDAIYEALLDNVRDLFGGRTKVPAYANGLTDDQRARVMALIRAYFTARAGE